jgi:hemoglobin
VSNEAQPGTLYERVGGDAFFVRLVDAFYDGVATDAVLLPLYPERPDLTGARHRLTLFLIQYWGGPTTYSDERGHPMLRMRHMPFHVGPVERDRWLHHMFCAIDRVTVPTDPTDRELALPIRAEVHERADDLGAVRDELIGYFVRAAEHLRNDTGLPIASQRPRSE